MNTITLVGRLTDNPRTEIVNGDKTVTSFRLAIDRTGTDRTDYVSIVCWNRSAEVAGTYLAKGRLVGVEGRLRHHEWADDNGQRHERHDVTANRIQFLDAPTLERGVDQAAPDTPPFESGPASVVERVAEQS